MRELVDLKGGPFDGMEMPRPSGRSVLIEVDGSQVARYRQGRDPKVFTFREYDTVILRRKPTEGTQDV